MVKIKNKNNEIAFILNSNEDLRIIKENKPFRIYLWIDDDTISLKEIKKFNRLFDVYELKEEKFNNGDPFSIDSILNKNKTIKKPRLGQDGGVIR